MLKKRTKPRYKFGNKVVVVKSLGGIPVGKTGYVTLAEQEPSGRWYFRVSFPSRGHAQVVFFYTNQIKLKSNQVRR